MSWEAAFTTAVNEAVEKELKDQAIEKIAACIQENKDGFGTIRSPLIVNAYLGMFDFVYKWGVWETALDNGYTFSIFEMDDNYEFEWNIYKRVEK